MYTKKFIFHLLLIIFFNTSVHAANKTEIINKVEKRYKHKNFRMDFMQESTLKALDINQAAGGFVIFSSPSKMYWEYSFPNIQKIITNGKTVWIYMKKNNQVMTGKSSDYFKEGSGGAFLTDISKITKYYDIQNGPAENILRLSPKTKSSQIKAINIGISLKDYRIQYIETKNKAGDTTKLYFKNEIFVGSIDNNKFNFTPPATANITKISE